MVKNLDFQYFVTHGNIKKKKNIALKIGVFVLVVLIFSGVVALGFYSNFKHKKNFKQSTFYFVCATKSKKYKNIEAKQEDVKKLGGAGKIYQKDKFYYLVLSVYDDFESANQVADLNKEIYPEIEVLEIKTEKIATKEQFNVKNNEKLYQFFKLSRSSVFDMIGLVVDRLSGDLSENKFCSCVLKSKFEFEDCKQNVEKIEDAELKNLLNSNISLMIMYHDAFLNSYFDSDKKNSVVCDFVVSLVLVYIDFINNL